MTGVKLSDLLDETGSTEVHIGGASISITYVVIWEARFTEDEWAEIRRTRTEGEGDAAREVPVLEPREYFGRVLPRLLKSWDLVDDDGQPIPITAGAFEQYHIPTRLLRMCETAVLESMTAGKTNGTS